MKLLLIGIDMMIALTLISVSVSTSAFLIVQQRNLMSGMLNGANKTIFLNEYAQKLAHVSNDTNFSSSAYLYALYNISITPYNSGNSAPFRIIPIRGKIYYLNIR